ncbi:Chaperone protein dnaJ [Malassezia obtusa]|uniref:Chaperone protein dnaJ n=1 Tax=Malassezia obtusa TaxID=76774 RepID=A0AAF0E264_9BASI|nr:Chaperone protein dnaJ [Malassezia obtusa]
MPNVQGEKKDYTQTQIEVVRRVKRAGGDFYSVLQIDKSATDSDIKKSYKKLALQLHPDKNRAPGADEAFKRMGAEIDPEDLFNMFFGGGMAGGGFGGPNVFTFGGPGIRTQYYLQRFSKDKSSPELLSFEQRVEEAWMKELYRQCEHAQEYKRRRLLDAQGFFGFGADQAKIAKIQAEVYESCEQLNRLFHIRV